jgi:GntR family transcriptional repressor for pyruvate dehydrogenase complex
MMKKDILFNPTKVKRAYEAVFEDLNEKITSGELNPGDKLPSERDLAKMYKRSHMTIREALRMLEQDGMIQVLPGGGSVVTELTDETLKKPLKRLLIQQTIPLRELIEYRGTCDQACIQWAASNRTKDDINNLKQALKDVEASKNDVDSFFSKIGLLHEKIVETSRNKLMGIVIYTMNELISKKLINQLKKMSVKKSKIYVNELYDIYCGLIDIICKGNQQKARTLAERHIYIGIQIGYQNEGLNDEKE